MSFSYMATILRAADSQLHPHLATFNLQDVAAQASQHVTQAKDHAAQILADAQNEAEAIRRKAADDGVEQAVCEFEAILTAQVAPAVAALQQAAVELQAEKQIWQSQWESGAVRLAAAIAEKIIRRELRRYPEITLDLVRESLELAAGSAKVCIHLSPADYQALGSQIRAAADAMSSLGDAELTADPAVTPGGCRIETTYGVIDQQIESQLGRIEEELLR